MAGADGQELVSTRQMLNKANEKVVALTEEVESYRSISKDLGTGGSTRTRVVRRAPEGSWLAKSARAGGRSVSGPMTR
jgi:transposase